MILSGRSSWKLACLFAVGMNYQKLCTRYVSEQGINLMRLIITQKSIINDGKHEGIAFLTASISKHDARTAIAKRADAI